MVIYALLIYIPHDLRSPASLVILMLLNLMYIFQPLCFQTFLQHFTLSTTGPFPTQPSPCPFPGSDRSSWCNQHQESSSRPCASPLPGTRGFLPETRQRNKVARQSMCSPIPRPSPPPLFPLPVILSWAFRRDPRQAVCLAYQVGRWAAVSPRP